jgi:hypothetical protein
MRDDSETVKVLEIAVRNLERENRELKQTLTDAFAAAALASGKSPYEAFNAARECMTLRKKQS